MAFVVIGVPSSAGAYGVGTEEAPAALREIGMIEALATAGIDVVDGGDLPKFRMQPDSCHPKRQNLETVAHVASHVRERVRSLLQEGHVPLVVGGDCTITLGVVAAAVDLDEDACLVYFDGDADMSTPATTRSGVLDAMGIAHLLDFEGADVLLADIGRRRPLLLGPRIALVGFEEEDLDADEALLLRKAKVHLFPASQVRNDPTTTAFRALRALQPMPSRVVHFDVDAVDSIHLPLAHFPHFNVGVTLDSAIETLAGFCAAPGLAAVVLTEVNPLHDPDREYLPRLVNGLATALATAPTTYHSGESQ